MSGLVDERGGATFWKVSPTRTFVTTSFQPAVVPASWSGGERFQGGVHRVGVERAVKAADDVLGTPRPPGHGAVEHGRHDLPGSDPPEVAFGTNVPPHEGSEGRIAYLLFSPYPNYPNHVPLYTRIVCFNRLIKMQRITGRGGQAGLSGAVNPTTVTNRLRITITNTASGVSSP